MSIGIVHQPRSGKDQSKDDSPARTGGVAGGLLYLCDDMEVGSLNIPGPRVFQRFHISIVLHDHTNPLVSQSVV